MKFAKGNKKKIDFSVAVFAEIRKKNFFEPGQCEIELEKTESEKKLSDARKNKKGKKNLF